MTLEELIEAVRIDFLDDEVDEDYPDDNLWTDTELTRYANWAVKEACRRANLIYDDETADVAVFTLEAGAYSAALHNKVRFVERVKFDGETLAATSEGQLDRCYSNWEDRTGTPQAFYYKGQHPLLVSETGRRRRALFAHLPSALNRPGER